MVRVRAGQQQQQQHRQCPMSLNKRTKRALFSFIGFALFALIATVYLGFPSQAKVPVLSLDISKFTNLVKPPSVVAPKIPALVDGPREGAGGPATDVADTGKEDDKEDVVKEWTPPPDASEFGHGRPNQSLDAPTVAIVVARMKDQDTDWIQEYFPQWQAMIYSVDDPTYELQAVNRGREGSAYLTYIIDHYDPELLPDYVIFHHPLRWQWHNDDEGTDAVALLERFRFEAVDEDGYVNLRCNWEHGCWDDEPREPTTFWDPERADIQWLALFGRALAELRPYEHGPTPSYPKLVQSPCCAQFVVSRETILKVPKKKYEQYRDFIFDWHYRKTVPEWEGEFIFGNNMTTDDMESALSGGLMEYMWHMIFGRPAVDCMPEEKCYCRNFGICDDSWVLWGQETIPEDAPEIEGAEEEAAKEGD